MKSKWKISDKITLFNYINNTDNGTMCLLSPYKGLNFLEYFSSYIHGIRNK